jgi:DNA-binding GntR family transcriptional regulator
LISAVQSTRVMQEMEAAILSGALKPRERLLEMELISRYGVSRTVIREALKRLEARGLIRTAPFRGATVADLTVEEVEELYFARVAIEKTAAGLVLKHIRPEEIQRLKALLRELESHLRRRTPQMIEKDLEFHRTVYQTCRNRYLCEIIDFLRTKAHIVGYNAWSLPQRIEQSILEHREILRAIEERDRGRLERLVMEHITFSKRSYQAQLKGLDQHFREDKEKFEIRISKSETNSNPKGSKQANK